MKPQKAPKPQPIPVAAPALDPTAQAAQAAAADEERKRLAQGRASTVLASQYDAGDYRRRASGTLTGDPVSTLGYA